MSAGREMNKLPIRKELLPLKTVVVKTGSRILTSAGCEARVEGLVEDLAALHASGMRVVLVSSGAIAHGMQAMGLTKRPSTIPLQQACASVGQNRLMHRYQACFERHDVLIGQVLLTWDDLRNKKRYLNLRNTMFQLLDSGIIPVVNENDSVGVEEIRFGTNDILGAQIAILVQADVLVNLTDVGGLFDRNPNEDPNARHIPLVKKRSEALHRLASDNKSEISVGGMSSKLKASDMVTRAGIAALIGDGFNHRLLDVLSSEECATLFLPEKRKMSFHHRWMAFSGAPQGILVVDDGAQRAIIDKGKSLLPAGVKQVSGTFKAGDNVDIRSGEGTVFARGLVNYSAEEIKSIAGRRSSEIEQRLGKKEFDEVIHRDNLVVL
jgi:glutamate 5-kinase